MPRTAQADGFHRVDAGRILGHVNAAHGAQDLPQNVVAQHQRFQTEPQKGRVHANRFVDHVQPGQSGHDVGDHLLPAGLHVRQLGVRNPRRRPARQVIEPVHLCAARRQQRLFGRPARHRPGAQIADERPGAEDRRMPRRHRVHIDDARQTFGHRLGDRQGDRRGGRRTRLPGAEQQHRHARPDAGLHRRAAFFGEFHRRHDKTVGVRHERPCPPLVLAPRHPVQKVETARHMGRVRKRCTHMLGCARKTGVERVDIHVIVVKHIAADHRPLEEVNVIKVMRDPRRVIKILRRGIAILVPLQIDDMHGSARRAEMHIGAAQVQVMLCLAPEQRDVAPGNGQHVFDQGARKPDAPVIALDGPGAGQDFHARSRRLT